jgi:hypothetical protein
MPNFSCTWNECTPLMDGNGGAIAVRGKAPRGLCEQYDPANPAAVTAAATGQQCAAGIHSPPLLSSTSAVFATEIIRRETLARALNGTMLLPWSPWMLKSPRVSHKRC